MLFPVTGLIIYQQQYRKANYKAREELSALNSTLQENIVGINGAAVSPGAIPSCFAPLTNCEVDKTIFHDSAVSATLEWIALVAITAVLWLGGLFVCRTVDFRYIIYSFAQRLFDPLRQFAEKLQFKLDLLPWVSDILNEPIEIRDPDEAVSREWRIVSGEAQAGEIRFEHVWFAYKDDDYVIKDLKTSLFIPVRKLGPTGAGKVPSSVSCAALRTQPGSHSSGWIRDLPQSELRCRMGVILQEGFYCRCEEQYHTRETPTL